MDIKALRDRYESDASRQSIINLAKSILERHSYKIERSFSFESFSAKLQRAYDDLEESGPGPPKMYILGGPGPDHGSLRQIPAFSKIVNFSFPHRLVGDC